MHCRISKNYGFTLIEIIIVIFILGIVLASTLGTFTGIISSSRQVEKRAELHQIGRALMDLISTDIRCIFSLPGEEEGLFFLGEEESIEGESMSKMDFVTANSLTMGTQKNPFLSEVGYRVKKDQDREEYSLWRRSQSPPGHPYAEGGREVPICRNLESFRLEFISDDEKATALSGKIPKAVVIGFSLNLDGEKASFVTMVRPMITFGG
jgi:prepilin-type N-terminal cleavage/methylation domain-containing protein